MRRTLVSLGAFLAAGLMPGLVYACACGCGIFDVQTGGMFPTGSGGNVWIEYDFMNQNRNWSGTSKSPAENNSDKDIRTNFFDVGAQYMFNRSWGIQANIPYSFRHFETADEDSGTLAAFNHHEFGDAKLEGIYTGFSKDMSTGLTFGVKLPTGNYTVDGFDRDTELGTGSTDLLLGAYHQGNITKTSFNWFINGQWDQPALITAGYRPGTEWDAAGGVYYDNLVWHGIKIAPIMQVLSSVRLSDRGPASDPDNTGYKRAYIAPAIEADYSGFHLYGDIAIPVYQQMIGNQLVAQELFTVRLSHDF